MKKRRSCWIAVFYYGQRVMVSLKRLEWQSLPRPEPCRT
jgi:hypothetical protein